MTQIRNDIPPETAESHYALLIGAIWVTVWSFAVCLLAVSLNALLYASRGPFYDSMAYLNHLAVLMEAERTQGILFVLRVAARGSTVFLPWLEAAVLAKFVEPSRALAIWIHAPWVLALGLSGYLYFRQYAGYPIFLAAAFATTLVSFEGVFFFNGGLSDLRMDLLQALTFGSAVAMYLAARARGHLWMWALFGVLMAAACLTRATTPVYLVLVFAPFAIADMVWPGRRLHFLLRYLLAGAIVAVLALWFYILNFTELYNYYFVWNADAIARLPLSTSIHHLEYVAFRHIGLPLLYVLGLTLAVGAVVHFATRRLALPSLNWRALWAGIAPVGYLVLSGAGLNPFVSMVAAPALMMFALAPLGRTVIPKAVALSLGIAALAASLLTASHGVRNHQELVWDWLPHRVSLHELVSRIATKPSDGASIVGFQSMYIGAIDTPTILNVLAYDLGFKLNIQGCAVKSGLAVHQVVGGYAQPAEWAAIPGATAAEKIVTIVERAKASADYLIIPEENSKLGRHVPINPYAFIVREKLLAGGDLEKVGDTIALSQTEFVSVYRNKGKKGGDPAVCGPL